MKGIRQAFLTQAGIAFPPSGAASEVAGGKGRRAGEFELTEEEMRTLTAMLHKHGGPRGIRLKNARLLMELPGNNLKMLPAGGNDMISLGPGTHPLLNHLRESKVRL